MSPRGLMLVGLCALVQAISNLLLRRGVLLAGGLNGAGAQFIDSLMRLIQQPLFVLGVVLYGVAALIWFSVLSREALVSSYPVLVGLTFAFVIFGGITFFQEYVSLAKVLGIAVILVGIVMVSRT